MGGVTMKGIIKVPLTDVYYYCVPGSEVVTQAVFATEVVILKEKGCWYQIQIPIQQAYSGWVKKEAVFLGEPPEDFLGKIIVRKHRAELKNFPAKSGKKIMNLVVNTRLWVIQEQKNWYETWRPGGETAWIQAGETSSWEKTLAARDRITGEQILNVARSFLGTPYLWGGITPDGADCSGFVYTVYALHGFCLHRDTDLQYKYDGFPVKLEEIRAGDLIYFYEDVVEKPTHVGIYEADQVFINASSKQNAVVRYSLSENNWRFKISGIKRILTV